MATAAQTAPRHASPPEASTHETKPETKRPMDPSDLTAQTHDPQEIAQLAYAYWEARGSRDGSAEEDWAQAEQALYGNSSSTGE